MKNTFEAFAAAVTEAFSGSCTVCAPAVTYTDDRGWHVSSAVHPANSSELFRKEAYSRQSGGGVDFIDSIRPDHDDWKSACDQIERARKQQSV